MLVLQYVIQSSSEDVKADGVAPEILTTSEPFRISTPGIASHESRKDDMMQVDKYLNCDEHNLVYQRNLLETPRLAVES